MVESFQPETLPSAWTLLSSFLIILFQLGIFALIIVLFVVNRAKFKQYYKVGLGIGIVSFALSLPIQIMNLSQIDMEKLMSRFGNLRNGSFVPSPEMAQVLSAVVAIVSVFFLILSIGWQMMVYVGASGEWGKVIPAPFPVLNRFGAKGWDKIGIAALVGVGAGILTMILVKLLGIGASDFIQTRVELMKPAAVLPEPVQLLFTLFFLWNAAITEEILYRGAILGFFVRLSKNRTAALLASIFFVSFIWALMHVFNTNSPAFKISQIFILGTIFAEFARRWSLESAIAAHLTLNTTVLAISALGIM